MRNLEMILNTIKKNCYSGQRKMFEIYNITSVIMKRIFLVKIKMSGDISENLQKMIAGQGHILRHNKRFLQENTMEMCINMEKM